MTTASIPPRLTVDDTLTVCAVAVLGAISASVLHEGLGHAVVAIATGNYFWISAAALSALIFILFLGRGVTISP